MIGVSKQNEEKSRQKKVYELRKEIQRYEDGYKTLSKKRNKLLHLINHSVFALKKSQIKSNVDKKESERLMNEINQAELLLKSLDFRVDEQKKSLSNQLKSRDSIREVISEKLSEVASNITSLNSICRDWTFANGVVKDISPLLKRSAHAGYIRWMQINPLITIWLEMDAKIQNLIYETAYLEKSVSQINVIKQFETELKTFGEKNYRDYSDAEFRSAKLMSSDRSRRETAFHQLLQAKMSKINRSIKSCEKLKKEIKVREALRFKLKNIMMELQDALDEDLEDSLNRCEIESTKPLKEVIKSLFDARVALHDESIASILSNANHAIYANSFDRSVRELEKFFPLLFDPISIPSEPQSSKPGGDIPPMSQVLLNSEESKLPRRSAKDDKRTQDIIEKVNNIGLDINILVHLLSYMHLQIDEKNKLANNALNKFVLENKISLSQHKPSKPINHGRLKDGSTKTGGITPDMANGFARKSHPDPKLTYSSKGVVPSSIASLSPMRTQSLQEASSLQETKEEPCADPFEESLDSLESPEEALLKILNKNFVSDLYNEKLKDIYCQSFGNEKKSKIYNWCRQRMKTLYEAIAEVYPNYVYHIEMESATKPSIHPKPPDNAPQESSAKRKKSQTSKQMASSSATNGAPRRSKLSKSNALDIIDSTIDMPDFGSNDEYLNEGNAVNQQLAKVSKYMAMSQKINTNSEVFYANNSSLNAFVGINSRVELRRFQKGQVFISNEAIQKISDVLSKAAAASSIPTQATTSSPEASFSSSAYPIREEYNKKIDSLKNINVEEEAMQLDRVVEKVFLDSRDELENWEMKRIIDLAYSTESLPSNIAKKTSNINSHLQIDEEEDEDEENEDRSDHEAKASSMIHRGDQDSKKYDNLKNIIEKSNRRISNILQIDPEQSEKELFDSINKRISRINISGSHLMNFAFQNKHKK